MNMMERMPQPVWQSTGPAEGMIPFIVEGAIDLVAMMRKPKRSSVALTAVSLGVAQAEPVKVAKPKKRKKAKFEDLSHLSPAEKKALPRIRAAIKRNGGKLPSYTALTRMTGVSRATAHRTAKKMALA